MEKYRIDVNAENCTGCRRCQLTCSELYTGSFNPSMARIHITASGNEYAISFTSECNECGKCVDDCFYDTLKKEIKEVSK